MKKDSRNNVSLKNSKGCALRVFRTIPRFTDSQWFFNSAYSCTYSYELSQCQDTVQSQQRKRCVGWSWGGSRRKLPRIFSQWSHTGPTSCPRECVVTHLKNAANQGSSSRLSTSVFCRGLAPQALSACPVPTLHTPTGKPLFSINHLVHIVYASQPLLQFWECRALFQKSKFPDTSQWPTS